VAISACVEWRERSSAVPLDKDETHLEPHHRGPSSTGVEHIDGATFLQDAILKSLADKREHNTLTYVGTLVKFLLLLYHNDTMNR
jgi:hypothetical protein